MKNLKIEVEKGFRRTLFEPELVGPNVETNLDNNPKATVKCGETPFGLYTQKGKQLKLYCTCIEGNWGNPHC